MKINPQFKNPTFYIMILSDALMFVFAIVLAYLFRFEFSLDSNYIQQVKTVIIWIVPLKIIVFFALGIYRGMWRYTSISDFWLLARASLLSTLLIMAILLYTNRFFGYSRAVFIVDGLFTFLLVGGVRIIIRSYYAVYGN